MKSDKLNALLKELEQSGVQPEIIVKAPGRANIIGEHVDYCDGLVLPFAIEQSMYFVGSVSPHPLYAVVFLL